MLVKSGCGGTHNSFSEGNSLISANAQTKKTKHNANSQYNNDQQDFCMFE